jgi:hypothetical protein
MELGCGRGWMGLERNLYNFSRECLKEMVAERVVVNTCTTNGEISKVLLILYCEPVCEAMCTDYHHARFERNNAIHSKLS